VALPPYRSLIDNILTLAKDIDFAARLGIHAPLGKPAERTVEGHAPLSPREEEVLRLISIGFSNAAIANELFISEATVKVHVRHILEKLGARSRTEAAVKFAYRQPYAAPSA
jgi:DNA-binding NarL/FixJ family response regulator